MKIFTLFILLMASCCSYSQRVVVCQGKSHTFNLLVDSTTDNKTNYACHVRLVLVYDKLNEQLVQTITPPENSVFCTLPEDQLLQIKDINFDGFMDFMIPQFTPAAPNIPYYYWRFNSKTLQFQRDTTLEDITSPDFNPDEKRITSFWKANCCEHGVSTYQYINGRLTLVEETESSPNPDNAAQRIFTRKKLVNGKLELVEQTVDKADDQQK